MGSRRFPRAEALGGARGPYALQAAIAACHARASQAEATDWARIAALYAELAARTPSPIVELNRAVAVSMADGPAAGLSIIDGLLAEPRCARTTCCPAYAAICCTSSVAVTKRVWSSSVRRR